MTQASADDLWRDFPKTAPEFEARFVTEDDCRAYWIEARWAGQPACQRCQSTHLWPVRGGTWFECADCRHQTSLTSGTLLDRKRASRPTWTWSQGATRSSPSSWRPGRGRRTRRSFA